jgi:hypothetical protein
LTDRGGSNYVKTFASAAMRANSERRRGNGEIDEGADLWHRHPTRRREQMHGQLWMLSISQQYL